MYKVSSGVLADRIKQARIALKMSQSELARMLGIKPQAVQHWENGTSSPKTERITDVAKTLDVQVSWLLNQEYVQEPSPFVYGQIEPDEKQILEMFRLMEDGDKVKFYEIAKVMAKRDNK